MAYVDRVLQPTSQESHMWTDIWTCRYRYS